MLTISILNIQEDITPEIQVRFGKEILLLDTWSINIQYQKLCDIIGPGITTHLGNLLIFNHYCCIACYNNKKLTLLFIDILAENEFLRDILQLGPKLAHLNGVPLNKQTKLERHLVNAAAFKARTLSLRKNRDKRSAVF